MSAFGLGGTNAHVILEQAPRPEAAATADADRTAHVFPISARSPEALAALAARHTAHLERHPELPPGDVCFTAATGRVHFPYRRAVAAGTTGDLAARLAASPASSPASAADSAVSGTPGRGRLAFLFTGQGAQYAQMGRVLYETEPRFREVIDHCARLAAPHLDVPLLELLYPRPGRSSRLDEVAYTQVALFAVEYALAELWRSWGIRPDLVMGHSTGEYAAACVAGVFGLEDGLRLCAARGRMLAERVASDGLMATVLADERRVAAALEPYAAEVSIAALNGPLSTVISGRAPAVERVCAAMREQGVETRVLNVERAGHSPLVTPMLGELTELFATVPLSAPGVPLVTNLTGEIAGPEIATPEHWARHARERVRFDDGVRALRQAGADAFLEIGPDPVLVGMGAYCLLRERVTWLPSLRRPAQAGRAGDDWKHLCGSLAGLYERGWDVDWAAFDEGRRRRRVELPAYPFERRRYWIDADGEPAPRATAAPDAWTNWLVDVDWAERPAPAVPVAETSLLIVADEGGFGTELAGKLGSSGARCTLVGPGPLPSVDRLAELLDGVDGVVSLTALDAPPADRLGMPADRTVWQVCAPALLLAQAAARCANPPRLWLVTRGAQRVREHDRVDGLAQAPVIALARVAALEHPELRPVCVDLDGEPGAADLDLLSAEITAPPAENVIAFRGGSRWSARLTRSPVQEPLQRPDFRADGTYWVTGGLGGLGLLTARWLAERGAGHVVLIGRSGPGAAARTAIESMRAAGAEVTTVQADVSRPEEVLGLFDRFAPADRPLRGIVHAAGVLDDGVIQQQTAERFQRALAPKVAGAFSLHTLSAERAPYLEHFVLFSSAASLVGNAGQSNHAAASAFLDALAHHRRAHGLPAVAVNWGAWTEVGALAAEEELKARLARLGFGAIPSAQGIAALAHLTARRRTQTGVVPMDWARFAAARQIADLPYYGALVGSGGGAGPAVAHRELERCPPGRRAEVLRRFVRDEVAAMLGLTGDDAAGLADDRPLTEYGVDSLGSIELRNRLGQGLDRRLPATLVIERPTVTALVDHLAALPWPERGDRTERAPAEAGPGPNHAVDPAAGPAASAAGRAESAADRPLSTQQERWLRLIAAGYGQRVVPIVFEAPLDRVAFRHALADVLTRHELLRYRYPEGRVEVLGVDRVLPADEELFRDLSALGPRERAQALGEQVARCAAGMPDPAERPSWRLHGLDWPGDRFLLLLSLQHLDFDGSSLTTFVNDLRAAYGARRTDREPTLPRVPGYAEYARWQRAYRAGPIAEDRAFFQGLYAALEKPTALPRHHGFERTRPFPARRHTPPRVRGLWTRVRERAAGLGVTPFSVLLAAYARVVCEVTGEPGAVIAMITNGRPDERFRDTIGPFTAPFPVPVPGEGSLASAARRCHRIVASINARSHYPVADLTEQVPAFGGLPVDSYFSDIGINFTNYRRGDDGAEPRARVIEILGPVEDAEFAAAASPELRRIPGLHLVIDVLDDELRFNFWYHEQRFGLGQVESWADRCVALVEGAGGEWS